MKNNYSIVQSFCWSLALIGLWVQSPSYANEVGASESISSMPDNTMASCQDLRQGRFVVPGSTAILVTPPHEIMFRPHGENVRYPIVLSPVTPIVLSEACQATHADSFIQADLVTHEAGFYIEMHSLSVAGHYVDLIARSEQIPFEQIPDDRGQSNAMPLCNLLNPSTFPLANPYDDSYGGNSGMQVFGSITSAICTYSVGQTAYIRQATLSPRMMFSLRLGRQGEGSLQAACVPSALRSTSVSAGLGCLPDDATIAQELPPRTLTLAPEQAPKQPPQ